MGANKKVITVRKRIGKSNSLKNNNRCTKEILNWAPLILLKFSIATIIFAIFKKLKMRFENVK